MGEAIVVHWNGTTRDDEDFLSFRKVLAVKSGQRPGPTCFPIRRIA